MISVHWLREGLRPACGSDGHGRPGALGTPFMSGVSCLACRTIIDLTIELVAVEDPWTHVPLPGPGFELSDVSGELPMVSHP